MKKTFTLAVAITITLISMRPDANASCYAPETARNTVKMLLAAGNAPAIKQVCGKADGNGVITLVDVVPQYFDSSEDVYQVRVRNTDCKVLDLALTSEKRAASACSNGAQAIILADERKTEFECRTASRFGRKFKLVSELNGSGRLVKLTENIRGREVVLKEIHAASPLGYFGIRSYKDLEARFVLDISMNRDGRDNYSALMSTRVGTTDMIVEMSCYVDTGVVAQTNH